MGGRAAAADRARVGAYPQVLDLGAGTALLSLLLSATVPGIRVTLVDGAPGMLAVAADQLRAREVPHRAVLADLADPLPAGRYDAVVTAVAVHHLDDAGKRSPYRRYREVWLARVAALGSDDEEIAAARRRMAYDRPAPVAQQCRWLAEAGLVDVDCFFKEWRFAVFGGRREAVGAVG